MQQAARHAGLLHAIKHIHEVERRDASPRRLRRMSARQEVAYIPPSGFRTVSLLLTDVTPATPLAISATLPTCEGSVTEPVSVTAPSLAITLMLPALISVCLPMAA